MPILSGDIKLLQSVVMADVPEGGGAATGHAIEDGTSNTIFPDISELDRAGGRVALRKVFAKVQTTNTDSYLGANVIVAEPPQDPCVSVTLFKALDGFEQRSSAQTRMEAYLFKGALLPGFLLENHIAGQRVIQLFYPPQQDAPPVGAALCLEQDLGLPTYQEQYVRVVKVESVLRQYTLSYSGGAAQNYTAKIVSLELSDPLRCNFRGSPPSEFFRPADKAAQPRETVVADASQYAACVPLVQSAALGSFGVRAQGIYTQLVPSAQVEVPITAQQPHAASALAIQAASPIQITTSSTWTSATALQLPGGFLRGSLKVAVGAATITDSAGTLVAGAARVGTCDYANGILALDAGSYAGNKTIIYSPAVQVLRAPQSTCIDITPESRSLSYVGFLDPVPMRASLVISYMTQGRWYALQDAGNGQIKGVDASYGAGTIHADTGAFVVTLGALPDVGSALVLQWGVPLQETRHAPERIKAQQRLQLSPAYGQMLQMDTLTLTWPKAGGGTCTATAAADGTLLGDATGQVWPGADAVDFAPHKMPPVGAQITADYSAGPKHIDDFAAPARNSAGKLAITASLGAITAGQLEVRWGTVVQYEDADTVGEVYKKEMGIALSASLTYSARDDGAGKIMLNGQQIGTCNYLTGEIVFNPDASALLPAVQWVTGGTTKSFSTRQKSITYLQATAVYPADGSGWVKVLYNAPGSASSQHEILDFAPQIRLIPGVSAALVPGSCTLASPEGAVGLDGVWRWVGREALWQDSGTGVLRFRSAADAEWITHGQIDYLTSTIALSGWEEGAANDFLRMGGITTGGEQIGSEYIFRTAAAPVRPGSLSVQFARAGGGVQTVTFPANGFLSSPGVQGEFDAQTGLVKLRFGDMVTAAGLEAEPWYWAGNVGMDGKIFKPAPIATSTLRYTAVAYSHLPLDAGILGLDPVRLPTDGRVPIFRPGGFAVVGHTGKITATVSNGQTINCARVRLSRVRVVGANGAVIHTGYTPDLEAGTVTFTDVNGYSQPVKIEHRIEDMVVLRDVQITGDLTFTRPLSHNYPASDSYISSALVAGDIFARVSHIFDQHTWDDTWADAPRGQSATASFNAAQNPVVVTNGGAITERWMLRFTNATAFDVIGEHVGVIATGNTATDCAPLNPATGLPYFTLSALGWGGGWAAGNVLRLNTIGAEFPFWVVRTVQQGTETVLNDRFTVLVRGDVDAPPVP